MPEALKIPFTIILVSFVLLWCGFVFYRSLKRTNLRTALTLAIIAVMIGAFCVVVGQSF
jgi:VIT1/CCC1 family predicted Fe2+/Mn2+ transporter